MLEMLSMYIWRRCREYIQLGFCLMVEKLTVLGEKNCWGKKSGVFVARLGQGHGPLPGGCHYCGHYCRSGENRPLSELSFVGT